MKRIVWPIIGGIVLGSLVFFAGPLILIVLLLKFIFTPFGMGRMMMYRGYGGPWVGHPFARMAMADKIRNMSDEEYTHFKEKMNHRFRHC